MINFLSIDTLTAIVNLIIYYLVVFTGIIFTITAIYIIFISSIEKRVSITSCNYINNPSKSVVKSMLSSSLLFYIFLIVVFMSLEHFNPKYSILNSAVESYITQTREPSIRQIKYKE